MFRRFTGEMRELTMAAVHEAERRGDRHIGTEHLVLGLVSVRGHELAAALDRDDVTLDAGRRELGDADTEALAAVGLGAAPLAAEPGQRLRGTSRRRRWWSRANHIPFTSGAKDTFEASLHTALERGDRHIGVEHLAGALEQRDPRDPGVALLRRLDLDPSALARALSPRGHAA